MKRRVLLVMGLGLIGSLVVGCTSKTPTPSDTNTPAASVTPTPTPTLSPTPTASAAASVAVTLSEESTTKYMMMASPASMAAGKITFVVTNTGKKKHEMVVLKTKVAGGKLPIGSDNKVSEATTAGEVEVEAGATESVTLTLAAGSYQLVCNLAGHYKKGMWATFTVS